MKTLVEEQEIQAAPAVSHNDRSRPAAPKSMESPKFMSAVASTIQSQADCHESCLELAALFIARG